MSKFNHGAHRPLAPVMTSGSPLRTGSFTAPDTRTFEGAPGWQRGKRTDLFLRATSSFGGGEKSFYESGEKRDETIRQLVRELAVTDFTWLCRFAQWLRGPGNIRTAALMIAADAVKARLEVGGEGCTGADVPHPDAEQFIPTNRWLIDVVCQRADEPGELLAYWVATYGRHIPKPVKRGLADAVGRLYRERSLLKYDTSSHAYRFADVIELCHPVSRELVGMQRWETDLSTGVECPHPEKSRFMSSWIHPGLRESAPQLRSYLCQCGWYHLTSQERRNTDTREAERQAKRLFIAPPTPQGELFQHAIDRRHNRTSVKCTECGKPAKWFVDDDGERCDDHRAGMDAPLTMAYDNAIPPTLRTVQLNTKYRGWANQVGSNGVKHDRGYRIHGKELHQEFTSLLDPEFIRQAGMTWEDVLSLLGSKVDKAKLWEAMIPNMQYMALLRNLRNFDEVGISNENANQITLMLQDPEQVARSRQLPFRFYSAYKNVTSLRWGHALETALDLCLPNIPTLTGRTLVLVDTSGSMDNPISDKSTLKIVEAAALFGSALAIKNPAGVDLHQFAMGEAQFAVPKGGSVLRLTNEIRRNIGRVGHGTDIRGAVTRQYRGHDRVIILTDGQGASWGGPAASVADGVPKTTPMYLFNVQSYSASPMPTGSAARFDLGGLTDATFALLPRLEAGLSATWPWELAATE